MYKVFCLVACLAVASAQVLREDEEYDPNPSYSFSYEVQDPLTGDSKSQSESRNGDAVQGSYTLIEADGSRRIVEYNADAVNGFNAVVHKEAVGTVKAVKPVAVARAPIALARAPIAVAHAPIAYAHAPITVAHAPVAVSHAPVAVAHAPALVHSAFNTPYATYAF